MEESSSALQRRVDGCAKNNYPEVYISFHFGQNRGDFLGRSILGLALSLDTVRAFARCFCSKAVGITSDAALSCPKLQGCLQASKTSLSPTRLLVIKSEGLFPECNPS